MTFDIAIIGSGFAGLLMAMIAKRLGHSVILLERARHPRFAIGESSTPLANLLLEELATKYDLPRLLPLCKWGSWQRTYPEIGCGLKRGFTFYHHRAGQPFANRADHADQLLVAASPHDHIADTHWYRADFDHFLVREAQSLGVEYLDEITLQSVQCRGDTAHLTGVRDNRPIHITARWIIDATGPEGFLCKHLPIAPSSFPGFPATQTLFTHFKGVYRATGGPPVSPSGGMGGPPVPLNQESRAGRPWHQPPYPPDSAAVHHVFDGGWLWSLRFNNGITSAGVMATQPLAAELRLADGPPAWQRLLHRFPSLQVIFADAQPTRPFVYAPSVAFRAAQITGPGWTLLPSAAGFVDPLLSTGFPLTLLGIQRLATIIEQHWQSDRFPAALEDYAMQTLAELDATAMLVGALYTTMPDFENFAALTLLYFAAASYSEAARRLNRPHLAKSFLLHDHPIFGPALRECCNRATGGPPVSSRATGGPPVFSAADNFPSLPAQVRAAITPIDIAGLARTDRANWYPIDANDTIAAAAKLGVDAAAIQAMLRRCGFACPSGAP